MSNFRPFVPKSRFFEKNSLSYEQNSKEGGALKEIYEKYWEAMYADALKRLGNVQLAEDCAQETFLLLCEKLKSGASFENEAGLCTYLYRVNANVASHMARKLHFDSRATEQYMCREPGEEGSVEEEVVNKVRAEALDEALRSIPLHYAIATVFRYGYNLSYAELAKNIGNTKEGARKISERGLKELQEKLNKEGE